jgi:hypothetical protein
MAQAFFPLSTTATAVSLAAVYSGHRPRKSANAALVGNTTGSCDRWVRQPAEMRSAISPSTGLAMWSP